MPFLHYQEASVLARRERFRMRRNFHMGQRRIVTGLAFIALIALAAGCATQRSHAVASRTVSDASRSTIPHELVGTWHGTFRPTGGADGGGGHGMAGDMMLEIKDDGTYTLMSTRRGRADAAGAVSKDSGVVAANGRTVTLKSSKGQWISLMHDGDALYGVSQRGTGYTIQISVERESGTFASPKLENNK